MTRAVGSGESSSLSWGWEFGLLGTSSRGNSVGHVEEYRSCGEQGISWAGWSMDQRKEVPEYLGTGMSGWIWVREEF